jgi:hypothetical protein
LFEWVGAAARSQPYDQEQDREGFHLLILSCNVIVILSEAKNLWLFLQRAHR